MRFSWRCGWKKDGVSADPLESDTYVYSDSLDTVTVLRRIGFGQVSVEFLVVLVPFNRIECLAGF